MVKRGGNGITLIELSVVMAIIALMGLFIAPTIGEWLDNYRVRQAAREVLSDLQFAKMKAISGNFRRYCTITFNITVAGTPYDYIVYPDYNNNHQLDGNVGDLDGDGIQENEENDIFKRVRLNDSFRHVAFDPSRGGGDGITFINNDKGEPSIAFDNQGLPRKTGGGFGSGTVFLKNMRNNKCIKVVVSSVGRIKIEEYQP
jgi:prepilin-type N-terminal cleavage/methylation domain-containing protein